MADWLRGMAVGDWYRSNVTGDDPFELVAVDVENEVVLVQHYDGTLEEFDFDSWMELGARPAAPPNNWSGAMDADKLDVIPDDDISTGGRWEDPLDFIDQRHS
jgi:hypothetical protein